MFGSIYGLVGVKQNGMAWGVLIQVVFNNALLVFSVFPTDFG